MAEMMTEPVRMNGHPALAATPHNHLVDAVRRHRAPVVDPRPQLRPVRLGVPCPDPDVAVEGDGGLVADPDDPRLAALAPDGDLPLPQVNVTVLRIVRVVDDPGQFRQPDLPSPGTPR
jgi:hypothetical protein